MVGLEKDAKMAARVAEALAGEVRRIQDEVEVAAQAERERVAVEMRVEMEEELDRRQADAIKQARQRQEIMTSVAEEVAGRASRGIPPPLAEPSAREVDGYELI